MPPEDQDKKSPSEDSQPTQNESGQSSRRDEDRQTIGPSEGQPAQVFRSRPMISSPESTATNYGSISSYNTAPGQRNEQEIREREQMRAPHSPSFAPALDTPMAPLSPQTSAKLRKPPNIRRASTKKQIPYRGQEFSVDDDPSELEQDQIEQRNQAARTTGSSSLRRQASTLRRRVTAGPTILPRVDSGDEEPENRDDTHGDQPDDIDIRDTEEDQVNDEEADESYEEDDLSDAESFTLKDRQLAINQTHPFGIRIWKPALYKKNRSVEKGAEEDIHSSPSSQVSNWLAIFNVFWTLLFGWWLALLAVLGAIVCFIFSVEPSALEYGRVLASLAWYLFYPFGQFVKLESDENYAEEDEGEGRSISEYERWQSGDLEHGRLFFGPIGPLDRSIVGRRRNSMDSADEHDSLLGRTGRAGQDSDTDLQRVKRRRLFGRGQWTLGRVIFFISFYFLVAPCMLLVSGICWFMVFWIPMGRVMLILLNHLRRHPLALTFHSDAKFSRSSETPSSVLVCTYRAVGLKYWKYTVDGTNIFLINMLGFVLFTILDYFILDVGLGVENFLTDPAFIFPLALFSVIPLAYFIGQAVASISAQSSMGLGAVVNAFFSTLVEVFLYCVALKDGKAQLVEGSIIGSIFAGILLLPGLSMCFGALKRKTQRFNVKSAGVTSTMLLFAVVAAFGPTLFYQIYGSHELKCKACIVEDHNLDRDCRRCFFSQTPALSDRFFIEAVRPYCWASAFMLFISYIIGLLFTLRTHAAVIWSTDTDEKKPAVIQLTSDSTPAESRLMGVANGRPVTHRGESYVPRTNVRDSQLYKRILGQSLQQVGLPTAAADITSEAETMTGNDQTQGAGLVAQGAVQVPHVVPPKTDGPECMASSPPPLNIVPGLSEEENQTLVRRVAEVAATAAAVAARDAARNPRKGSSQSVYKVSSKHPIGHHAPSGDELADGANVTVEPAAAAGATGGGHDAPNWSKTKSVIILLVATVAYAIIAEILVDTVDVVLQSANVDQKFLGLTLFALVPNTTEFLNGISFAMNGNIALSMEIGSAYALQVCLLQIPALVAFSAFHGRTIDPGDLASYTFNLLFPQWDMILVILSVLLLSNLLGEGKSNYFKGSILVLTYLVAMFGFWFSGYDPSSPHGVKESDGLVSLSAEDFWTRGRSSNGRAY